ncbi:MAG TPA: hypothetical protein PLQ00_14315, partial [Thermoguttaceae bacterium]|nr:hypothetical protein [Thermoguttaceae bacterium]
MMMRIGRIGWHVVGRVLVQPVFLGAVFWGGCCWSISQSRAAEPGSVVAPGAKLEKLADQFRFTEGPAADAKGNVFFTDQPNDRILCWT